MFFLKITNEGVASLDSRAADDTTITAAPVAGADLHISDLGITQYDKLGIGIAAPTVTNSTSNIAHQSTAVRDGRNFVVTLDPVDINPAAAFMTGELPAGAFQTRRSSGCACGAL